MAAIDSALALAARGLRVFPIIPNGKTPAFSSWQDLATTDPDTIRQWYATDYADCGVAVATGRGLMVLDADVKRSKPGLHSLDLIALVGADLDFTVDTPSGGRHAYFTVPDGQPVPNSVDSLADYPGIDIRGDGGYVCAPGTPNYVISSDQRIPQADQWLIETARRARRIREKQSATPLIDLDLPENVERAKAYLAGPAPYAIEGDGGNEATYKLFCHLKDLGLSKDTALDLAAEHWNEQKASPPWGHDELAILADNAFAYGSAPPGKLSALAEFDPVEHPADDSLGFARPVTYGDASPPPRHWLVDRFIPRYKATLLTGDGGVGKSLLGQHLLTSVATQADFFGLATEHGPVIAVFSEDDEAELWRRQVDINRACNLAMGDLGGVNWWTADHVAEKGCVLMSFTRENPEGRLGTFYRRLEAAIASVKPALVLLDPVANMFGGSEIDRSQVTLFINRTVNRLCVQHKTTAVVLAHPSVAGMAEGSGRSGSTGWSNAVRSRLYLSRPENDPSGDYRVLTTTKANYGRFGDQILLRWSQGAFVRVEDGAGPDELARVGLFAAVKALLGAGEVLSDSPFAPNYVVRRAMGRPEVKGLERAGMVQAFDQLLAIGALRVVALAGSQGRMKSSVVLGEQAVHGGEFD